MRFFILVMSSICSIPAFASPATFLVECSETILPSGESISMTEHMTLWDDVSNPSAILVIPNTPYQAKVSFHLDLTKAGNSTVDMQIFESNATPVKLNGISTVLHLDGYDQATMTYHSSKEAITDVVVSCSIKPATGN